MLCMQPGGRRGTGITLASGWAIALLAFGVAASPAGAQSSSGDATPAKSKVESPKDDAAPAKPAPPKLGLLLNEPKALQGYTLLSPMNSTKTYLIDMQGRIVNKWETNCNPAMCAVLLDNGHLLRPGMLGREGIPGFGGIPGAGGRVQEFTWEGELVWDFKFQNEKYQPHHDITRLPNGNVILVAQEKRTGKEAVAAGRRPELVGDQFNPDCLLEIKPTGKTTGEVVWEWHLWDHLVQDFDKSKPGYGNVAEHPELVNVNYGEDILAPIVASKDGADKLKSIGYVGSAKRGRINSDWTHTNSVAHNPQLDQIVLSVHNFSEVWVIDHGTTTAEAASHQGGRSGKGGDVLYRWGNPLAYRAGKKADQRLFAQHSAHWIPQGLPGAGHILVFNNGGRRPDGNYSSVDEIVPPVDAQGRYASKPGTAFGPDKPAWSYAAATKSEFYSMLISGAQRLPNGNTLICSGVNGTIFEVTPENDTVWKYVNPAKASGGLGGGGFGPPGRKAPGGGGPGGAPQPGELLATFVQDFLKLTDEQKKQLEALHKEIAGKLDKLLTDDQQKQLKDARGGFGGLPQPGQIMTAFQQARLKMTDEQKRQMEVLQKDADAGLDKLFSEDQKKQFKELRDNFARGPGSPKGPGGGAGTPKGPGGPGGGFPGFGPPGGSSLFRAFRYAADHPGLKGRELAAGKTIDELEREEAKAKEAKAKEAKAKEGKSKEAKKERSEKESK